MPGLFQPSEKFVRISSSKNGTVVRLRSDEYETNNCWPNGNYHYSVNFDDGTFETYLSEYDMKKL